MAGRWAQASGEVVRGHRVASGACGDPRFPEGTIAPQLAFFRAAIAGFDEYLGGAAFPGTINVKFANRAVILRAPEIRLAAVRWTLHFPPETFLLSRCSLGWARVWWPAFLYIPDPATKPDHHQAPSDLEVLSGLVPSLDYGSMVTLRYAAEAVSIG